jgi:hypothetical protein
MPGLLPFLSFFIAGIIELVMIGMASGEWEIPDKTINRLESPDKTINWPRELFAGHKGFVEVAVAERPLTVGALFCKMIGGVLLIAPLMMMAMFFRS